MKNIYKNKIILVTGGTGSLGKALVKKLLKFQPKTIRVFDIDENRLFTMEHEIQVKNDELRFFLGDVRDKSRLRKAAKNVDFIFHLAALKHVMSCEYNAFEAVKTNVLGIQNIIEVALENNVEKVIFTSSDKAANPNNTMGATKLLGERLMTSAQYYRGSKRTIFSSVRFGNVIGSRGSVVDVFKKQIKDDLPITITNPEMTRFIMSIDSALQLVLKCAEFSKGGEVFVLRMPIIKLKDLADGLIREIAILYQKNIKNIKIKTIGMKPGETEYEDLMTETEAEKAFETKDLFVIPPEYYSNYKNRWLVGLKRTTLSEYNSKSGPFLSINKIRIIVKGILEQSDR